MDDIVFIPTDRDQQRTGERLVSAALLVTADRVADAMIRSGVLHELRVLPAPIKDVWSGLPDTDRAWRHA